MRKQKHWLALALGCALAVSACAKEPAETEDPVSFMDDDEPMMQKAYERARRELDDFLAVAKSPANHFSDFALKVGLHAGDQTEYVWISEFEQRSDGRFTGTINNDVQLTDKFKLGDRHTFGRDEIVDWIYIDNRELKMHGNYTLCALLTQEDPDEAAAMREKYKLDCDLT